MNIENLIAEFCKPEALIFSIELREKIKAEFEKALDNKDASGDLVEAAKAVHELVGSFVKAFDDEYAANILSLKLTGKYILSNDIVLLLCLISFIAGAKIQDSSIEINELEKLFSKEN